MVGPPRYRWIGSRRSYHGLQDGVRMTDTKTGAELGVTSDGPILRRLAERPRQDREHLQESRLLGRRLRNRDPELPRQSESSDAVDDLQGVDLHEPPEELERSLEG